MTADEDEWKNICAYWGVGGGGSRRSSQAPPRPTTNESSSRQQHPPPPQYRHYYPPHGHADYIGSSSSSASSSTAAAANSLALKRRRVRSILALSTLAFAGILLLDGLLTLNADLSRRVDRTVQTTVENAAELLDDYERRLINHNNGNGDGGGHRMEGEEGGGGVAGRFLRRLVDSLLVDDEEDEAAAAVMPPHRSFDNVDPNDGGGVVGQEERLVEMPHPQSQSPPPHRGLHALPLLPKRALQHRRRRELISKNFPLPIHVRENEDDELYHSANAHRRRRMYPTLHDNEDGRTDDKDDATIDYVYDARRLVKDDGSSISTAKDDITTGDGSTVVKGTGHTLYETGALYQGYGTHYLDLWVGSPPQRQTVIVDTGSSITAFPCSGCDNCGNNLATGERYHLDDDYNVGNSATFEEKSCHRGSGNKKKGGGGDDKSVSCDLGTCVKTNLELMSYKDQHVNNANDGQSDQPMHNTEHCQLAVSYAEGSSWTALEGSDIVYPAGPHEVALESREERLENGVGVGMGMEGNQKEFDWMDFRLRFGCQTKVTGLFRTQLEDGIMGMDNRRGAFWLQLHEHYKRNGYVADDGNSDSSSSSFDPSQFSLCYDRQPLSMDLTTGVGSGTLTLGGTDPLLHNSPMVYAQNIARGEGWYTVRIKAMFLRTKGGTLSEGPFLPEGDTEEAQGQVEYVRVKSPENDLNGQSSKERGVIIDSGTTDTYLPQGIKAAFDVAWKEATNTGSYHNNAVGMSPEEVKSLPTILIVLQGHPSNDNSKNDAPVGSTRSHEAMFKKENNEGEGLETISDSDVVIAIPPTHYMEESNKEPGTYTARIYFTERYGAQSILGSNVLMGHEVNFDVGKGRIGIAESHCNYERYVQERDLQQGGGEVAVSGQEQEVAPQVAAAEVSGAVAEEDAGPAEAQQNVGGNDLAASGWALR